LPGDGEQAARHLLRGLSGSDAAANANWDKAAEHAARCALYVHHKLALVERSPNRKLNEMTTEELEAAAREARKELAKLTENEGASRGMRCRRRCIDR
jgi:hypothetical protein